MFLPVPARDVVISPNQAQFAVNDVINCTAVGYPVPTVKWIPVNTSSAKHESGASLVIDEDMNGFNVWNCIASNELNSQPVVAQLSFTVGGKSKDTILLVSNVFCSVYLNHDHRRCFFQVL
jgi:hypothetical protein